MTRKQEEFGEPPKKGMEELYEERRFLREVERRAGADRELMFRQVTASGCECASCIWLRRILGEEKP